MSARSRLIYFAPVGRGGLAKYAVFQARALKKQNVALTVLGHQHLQESFKETEIEFVSLRAPLEGGNKVSKTIAMIRNLRHDAKQLSDLVKSTGADSVVFTSFVEYFSPFWAATLSKRRREGVRFGTVVHDPIRDFKIGPSWWHQYCISKAYSFVDVAFVHSETAIDAGWPTRNIPLKVVPHGPYDVPTSPQCEPRSAIRDSLGIPSDATVVLSFGHIRDGKNLDLAIAALKTQPRVHLLVVGREQSTAQRPVASYQAITREEGVAERCHWVNEFVADEDVQQYFQVSDILLLLYSADFRSASGVLSLASQFELPVLASSGLGPLKDCVEKYNLGIWVEPDKPESVKLGLQHLIQPHELNNPDRRWDAFRADHSWEANAKTVLHSLENASNQ